MSVEAHSIPAQIHGRYLTDRPNGPGPWPLLVGFHGYGERAEDMLAALQRMRGEHGYVLVSVQALNRFYTRTQEVVANWMTREDRELVIADNLAYVTAVVRAVRDSGAVTDTVVYAGFSQGVAMAYRAAAFAGAAGGLPPASGAIMLAGDVPPDVAPHVGGLPPVLIGRGTADTWYTEAKGEADVAVFRAAGREPHRHVFEGGHVWHDSFISAAHAFLGRLQRYR